MEVNTDGGELRLCFLSDKPLNQIAAFNANEHNDVPVGTAAAKKAASAASKKNNSKKSAASKKSSKGAAAVEEEDSDIEKVW